MNRVFPVLICHQTEPAVPKQLPSHPAAPRPAASSLTCGTSLGPTAPAAPRDTLEYRTALELELWKEEQEDLFDDQVNTCVFVCICVCVFVYSVYQIMLFALVKEEGAEPHAGSGRGVEEKRQRERSSGQQEGGEFTATYRHTQCHKDFLFVQTHKKL